MMKHTFSIELKGQGTHCAIFLTIILGSISRLCSFLGFENPFQFKEYFAMRIRVFCG
jgi:hypothetical protein